MTVSELYARAVQEHVEDYEVRVRYRDCSGVYDGDEAVRWDRLPDAVLVERPRRVVCI